MNIQSKKYLDNIIQNWIFNQTSLNSVYGDLCFRNGNIDSNNISRLSDYIEQNYNFKKYISEIGLKITDNFENIYVVPAMMPDGKRIELVVDNNGFDIAQIYINNISEKEEIENVTISEYNNTIKDENLSIFLPLSFESLAQNFLKEENNKKILVENEKIDNKDAEKNNIILEDEEKKEIYDENKLNEPVLKAKDNVLRNIKKFKTIKLNPKERQELNLAELHEKIENISSFYKLTKEQADEINLLIDETLSENKIINNIENNKNTSSIINTIEKNKNENENEKEDKNEVKQDIEIKCNKEKIENILNEHKKILDNIDRKENNKILQENNIETLSENEKENDDKLLFEKIAKRKNNQLSEEISNSDNKVFVIINAKNGVCEASSEDCSCGKLVRGIDKLYGFKKAHYSKKVLKQRAIGLQNLYNLTKEQAKRIDTLIYTVLCDYDDCIWLKKKIVSNKAEEYVKCMSMEFEKNKKESKKDYLARCQNLRIKALSEKNINIEYELKEIWKNKNMNIFDKIVMYKFSNILSSKNGKKYAKNLYESGEMKLLEE